MNSKQMKEFMKALESIVEEKKVDKNIVIESMEQTMCIIKNVKKLITKN